jgi:hypothetical protein
MGARATAVPALVAAALGIVYLAWAPPSTDLAAQTFRAELFDEAGFALWNNAWYGGHYTLGYSVLFPPLAWLVGVRLAGVLAAVAAAALFGAIAARRFGERALIGSLWFGVGVGSWLYTGRLTFLLGVAIGLAAILALDARKLVLAAVLAALCALASPVAGLFLAIAGVALALGGDRSRAAAIALPPLAAMGALALAFSMEGDQPYAFTTFVAILLFAPVALLLIPRDQRVLRIGVVVYALIAIAMFVIPNPVGSNIDRLGALFAGPVAALVLAPRAAVLAVLAVPLLYWQLGSPVDDLITAVGEPETEREYFEPLVAELDEVGAGQPPFRIQIPPTENRWEAAYVAPKYPLARGWLRQLESEDIDLFTDGNLTPEAYRRWLDGHAVSYVAVADATPDYIAEDEVQLVADGLPYLDEVWSNEHWRLFAVDDPQPLGVADMGYDWFEVDESALVRITHTAYWSVVGAEACVGEAGLDSGTAVEVKAPGTVRVEASLFGDDCPG